MTLQSAEQLSFDRCVVAQPVWNRFSTAADAVALPAHVLLHAGPAFTELETIPHPMINSACVAAVYEGLATDFDAAEEGIRAGDIQLRPAQDYGVVTPLAAVVSASMPLHVVYDAQRGNARAFAPINGGPAPGLRLGLRQQAVLDHIRWLNGPVRDVLSQGLGEGIGVLRLAAQGLAGGDDCHGLTSAAHVGLMSELNARTRGSICDQKALTFLHSAPSIFLNLWMAATKCMLRAAEDVAGSGFVTAAGGNGFRFGIQVAGLPGRWFTAPATPPLGRIEADVPAARALPAIGDSAVVEALGLGAMALHLSPAQREALGPFMPPEANHRRSTTTIGRHPAFRRFDVSLGLSARAIVAHQVPPVVGLGIVDADGTLGRLGAGVYEMPVEVFTQAVEALDAA